MLFLDSQQFGNVHLHPPFKCLSTSHESFFVFSCIPGTTLPSPKKPRPVPHAAVGEVLLFQQVVPYKLHIAYRPRSSHRQHGQPYSTHPNTLRFCIGRPVGLESVSDIGSSGLNTGLNSYAHPVERGLRGFRGWMAAKGHLFCMPVHNDLYVCRTYMLFFHIPSRTATEPHRPS